MKRLRTGAFVLFGSLASVAPGEVEILNVSIERESSDEVELTVTYRLSQIEGPAYLGAITLFQASSTGHWSYRPVTLETGTHTAVVTVGRNPDAPSVYRSDAFQIDVWGGARSTYRYSYPKLWCAGGEPCDDKVLREEERAPLVERLTSVQPSIRAAAVEEVEVLDEKAKRALLPGILERVHHADLGVRFNALYVLKDWGIRDAASTVPLVEAMQDPHPGISRVATRVLVRIAMPDDALAEEALCRATSSSDETTRTSAEAGLERIRTERRLAMKPTLGSPIPETELSCQEAGGRWGLFGLYRIAECNLPTPDAGVRCVDSMDCVSVCVAENETRSLRVPMEGSGACYGWTIVRGTCLYHVRDGRIHPQLCVD